jgi:drug/metabolite transporter superfamily protein YnfA
MNRERALKIVLVLIGLLFMAAVYPLFLFWRQQPPLAMMLSLYVPMGLFLLLAARNPSEHRSLMLYAAWANIAHAAVMGVQEANKVIARRELVGVAVFLLIGIALLVLAPKKEPAARLAAASA